jgi:hypothetical protein
MPRLTCEESEDIPFTKKELEDHNKQRKDNLEASRTGISRQLCKTLR